MIYATARRVLNAAGNRMELGDLVQTGVLGLYRAIDKYDPAKGVPFSAFALPYVKGAMLDELAKHVQIPRSIRDKHNKLKAAFDELSRRYVRSPTDEELAEFLGISLERLGEWLTEVGWTAVWSVEELELAGTLHVSDNRASMNPATAFAEKEDKALLVQAIRHLSLREQQLLYAYYQEELTFKEIGYVMDLSESQVSRIHSKAIVRLRALLERDA